MQSDIALSAHSCLKEELKFNVFFVRGYAEMMSQKYGQKEPPHICKESEQYEISLH